jgi:hypothetical protein
MIEKGACNDLFFLLALAEERRYLFVLAVFVVCILRTYGFAWPLLEARSLGGFGIDSTCHCIHGRSVLGTLTVSEVITTRGHAYQVKSDIE